MTNTADISKTQKVTLLVFSLIALLIIADFIIPGRTVTDKVAGYGSTTESHNNAGGGSYFSYRIDTESSGDFPASEEFARSVQPGNEIELNFSRVFGKVNLAKVESIDRKETYSFRIATGLIQPLLTLLVLLLHYRSRSGFGTLLFVFQVMLLANLVYLLY